MNKRTENLMAKAMILFSENGNSNLGDAIVNAEKLGDKLSFRFKEAIVLEGLYQELTNTVPPPDAIIPSYTGIEQVGEGWGSSKDRFSTRHRTMGECALYFGSLA